MGDGFFVPFETPDDAVGRAVAIQGSFDEHRRERGSRRLSVSDCMNASDAASKRPEGVGVHIAARIGAIAESAQMLVSTRDAHDGWRSLGPLKAPTRSAESDPRAVRGRSDRLETT
jgi:class 3 adenylate cyclase